jgi:hypothetical protein
MQILCATYLYRARAAGEGLTWAETRRAGEEGDARGGGAAMRRGSGRRARRGGAQGGALGWGGAGRRRARRGARRRGGARGRGRRRWGGAGLGQEEAARRGLGAAAANSCAGDEEGREMEGAWARV